MNSSKIFLFAVIEMIVLIRIVEIFKGMSSSVEGIILGVMILFGIKMLDEGLEEK